MKKILFLCIFCICGVSIGFSQTYRNEWIDFTKKYYKFIVPADGVYRIYGSNLQTTGITYSSVQDLKLWRNGVEVPIYTSVPSGQLGNNDYIEFWGKMNDGKPDAEMYLDPTYQTNDLVSLETDNSSYFLTVNPSGTNARLASTINNLTNPGTPKPYFIDTLFQAFRDELWGGEAQYVSGEYVRSSSYDKNEGWGTYGFNNSNDLGNIAFYLYGMHAYTKSDAPTMRFTHTGGGAFIGTRKIATYLNDSLIDQQINTDFANYSSDVQQIPTSRISGDGMTINIKTDDDSTQFGQIIIGKYKLVYPRTFDFSNNQQTYFAFDLPADAAGTYLKISNFQSSIPVLIDQSNGRRYTGTLDGNGFLNIKLQPSSIVQHCVLYAAENYSSITSFTARQFTDYSQAANQGDFMLIANYVLNSNLDGIGNQVEAYRSYRASTTGGGYNAKIYDVDELTDQFAYGINKHPIAIRNFLQYARAKFTTVPKFALLVGHGVDYSSFYGNQTDALADRLNMVPTWGYPASDILLSASSKSNPVPATPIGRISVVNSTELANYLQKVKEYDSAQVATSYTQADKGWRKKVALLVGAGDDVASTITDYMTAYKKIITDTLAGADAPIYTEYHNANLQQTTDSLTALINSGVSMIDYFGHSSTTALQFNLDNPNNYTNTRGKYPFFSISGCNAGNFFIYDQNRYYNSIYTISEQFLTASERGSIAVLASTHFGVVNTLDYQNTQLFNALGVTRYGKSLGEVNQKANDSTWKLYNGDFFTRLTLEETTLNGDPSIKIFSALKPDYSMETQNITISPSLISMATDSFTVAISVHNIGRATNDSVTLLVQQQYPNGTVKQIGSYKLKGVRYADSLSFKVPIIGNLQKGTNYIIATLDTNHTIDEISETNNTATVSFIVSSDQLLTVYPYNFSIVNKPAFKLIANTADPYQASRAYQVQMDTTELFNSPLLASNQVTQVGGEVEFTPPISNLVAGTVYYWRVAPIVSGNAVNYQTASFLYNPGGSYGWNQSNLYQHFKSGFSNIALDSTSRKFGFTNQSTSLQVNHAYYFGDNVNGGTEANDFTTFINGNAVMYNDCESPAILFIVFDNIHFTPWVNYPGGLYGSVMNNCTTVGTQNNFEFHYNGNATTTSVQQRKKIMDFMNLIPDGYYVVAKLIPTPIPNFDSSYTQYWRRDTLIYGSGQSVPDYFFKQGFTDIDQETSPRFWTVVYKKNDMAHFKTVSKFSVNLYDKTSVSVNCPVPYKSGMVTSPVFGPAAKWKNVHWSGHPLETTSPFPDSVILQVVGMTPAGVDTVLLSLNRTQPDYDISNISAAAYPNLKLRLLTTDSLNGTPWQLDQWRLDYQQVPEGALAPNLYSTANTMVTNATVPFSYKFGIAFKNISDTSFNSLKLKLRLTNPNGSERTIALPPTKALLPGDTAHINFEIPADTLSGIYNIYLGVNVDRNQPEQFLFNNFLYKQFTVANVLPVNFIGFQAVPSASNVALQWQVTNEAGSSYYEVQRSADGLQFSAIGKVAVNNNNALMNTYDLLDKTPVIGQNYYRIKIVNQDGTFEYSVIRAVTFGKGDMVKVYPNPVKDVLHVNLSSDGKLVTLVLTNATGQQMLQKNTLGTTQIDMGKYAAGIYYLQVKDATGSTMFRVEKQ